MTGKTFTSTSTCRAASAASSSAPCCRSSATTRGSPGWRSSCRIACGAGISGIAWKIYEARRTRYRMLDRDLLGEPAWDMLLALYCLPERGERLSVSSLSLAAELPQSTGHRWQFILAQRDLIDQVADPSDWRRQFIELSNKGRDLLESYLTQLFRCGNYLAS